MRVMWRLVSTQIRRLSEVQLELDDNESRQQRRDFAADGRKAGTTLVAVFPPTDSNFPLISYEEMPSIF